LTVVDEIQETQSRTGEVAGAGETAGVGISVRSLRKNFQSGKEQAVRAIDSLSIDVKEGEFLVVLGPSGSGKTTLLRCIAGLDRADSGEIVIGGQVVYSSEHKRWVSPDRRGISMVFQGYALWPHMTTFDNVAYPLRSQHMSSKAIAPRVERALELVGCGHLSRRYPGALSGGQQQRVALARAIVGESPVVLFDEPLSNVDARVREELRRELVNVQRELGFTAVYITHDQSEAMVMGHRVAILAAGQIVQVAPPKELYHRPASTYVAEFTGGSNQFAATVEEESDAGYVVASTIGRVRVTNSSSGVRPGESVVLVARPEHCHVSVERPAVAHANAWPATIEGSTFFGYATELVLRVQGQQVIAWSERGITESSNVWLSIEPDDLQAVLA
jgi:iron(III) transport system ATP-binding protein